MTRQTDVTLALDGTLLSIRRFGARPLLFADLVAKKSVTQEMVDFISACVRARLVMNPLVRRRAKNTWIRRFCRLSSLVRATSWQASGT